MIFILLSVALFALSSGQLDPCTNYVTDNQVKRSAQYTPKDTEPNICDNKIDESVWYRFEVLFPSRLHDQCVENLKCGTARPIWMRGEHPTAADPGPKSVEVCAYSPDGCCRDWKQNIMVKYCKVQGDEFYVYRLKRVPSCDMAYCAGDSQACTEGLHYNPNSKKCTEPHPKISKPIFQEPISQKKILRTTGKEYDDFYFVCEIQLLNPSPDRLANGEEYEVVFLSDGQEFKTKKVDGTNLRVQLWSEELLGQAGKKIGCKVRSLWKKMVKLRSEYLFAERSHYVGIQYSLNKDGPFDSPRIEIDEKDPPLTIYFKPTVPVSCPASHQGTSCKISVYMADVEENSGLQHTDCHITFSAFQEIVGTLKIHPAPTAGLIQRVSVIRFTKITGMENFFWDNYLLPDIHIHIKDTIVSKHCSSTGDPHITTYDGRYYHNFQEGDFILTKSESRHFEVHARHYTCNRATGATCNCAVVVREGNNALGVYACNGPHFTPTPTEYLVDPDVPGASLTPAGNRFTITMPSGARVIVDWIQYYLNIYVYINPEDYGKTTGLCGTFNGNHGDDTVPKGTTTQDARDYPVTFSESYRLAPTKSFINGYIYRIECLKYDELLPSICKCSRPQTATCTKSNTKLFKTKFNQNCGKQDPPAQRRKRDASGNDTTTEEEEEDMVITEEDMPLQTFNVSHGNVSLTWPTPGGIDEAGARSRCNTGLEKSPVYQDCISSVNQEKPNMISSCMIDIQITDDVDASVESMVKGFQTSCVQKMESSVVKNITNGTTDTEVEVVLSKVMGKLCPDDCKGNGNCVNGTCVCKEGFAGESCFVNTKQPPKLSQFRKAPICDFRNRPCFQTSIFATNFYDSAKLLCKVTAVDKPRDFRLSASLVSMQEIVCPLPVVHRFINQSQILVLDPAPVHMFDISLTNDDQLYSNSVRMTVYDSKCRECNRDGICKPKPDTCVIGGMCYKSGEASSENKCKTCNPSHSTDKWFQKTGCSKGSSSVPLQFQMVVVGFLLALRLIW